MANHESVCFVVNGKFHSHLGNLRRSPKTAATGKHPNAKVSRHKGTRIHLLWIPGLRISLFQSVFLFFYIMSFPKVTQKSKSHINLRKLYFSESWPQIASSSPLLPCIPNEKLFWKCNDLFPFFIAIYLRKRRWRRRKKKETETFS